jgi:hypothetical protein
MKTLLIFALCLISTGSFADHHEEMQGKTFEEKKAMMIKKIDTRISYINEMKSCISAATNEEAIKVCREKMKSHKELMKKKWNKLKGQTKK